MRSFLSVCAFLVLLVTSAGADIVRSNADLSLDPRVQTKQIKALIRAMFPPNMAEHVIFIADCETGGQAVDKYGNKRPNGIITHIRSDGKFERNPTTGAIGAFQIWKASHSAEWIKNYDPTDIVQAVKYTKFLITGRIKAGQNIYADWLASEHCHGMKIKR